jgi:Glycosyltransferase family 28 C-terminal domain
MYHFVSLCVVQTCVCGAGKGGYEPAGGVRQAGSRSVRVASYRYKPTLSEDMAAADLIISHAGAGSIMVSAAALPACVWRCPQACRAAPFLPLCQLPRAQHWLCRVATGLTAAAVAAHMSLTLL